MLFTYLSGSLVITQQAQAVIIKGVVVQLTVNLVVKNYNQ